MPRTELDAAVRPAPSPITLGDNQLGQSLDSDRTDQERVPGHVNQCQRSSTSSEQNPGPIAISTPGLPFGGCLAIVSRKTCNTEDDERLPTSLSERQANSRASSGRPRVAMIDSMIFGPPGWLTQVATSAMLSPCVARNSVTSSPNSSRRTGCASLMSPPG